MTWWAGLLAYLTAPFVALALWIAACEITRYVYQRGTR